jgi:hypothetical protein
MLKANNTIGKKHNLDNRPCVTTPEKFGSSSTTNRSDFSAAPPIPNGELTNHHRSMNLKARDPKNSASNGRRRPRFYLNKFRVPIYIQLCVVICILCGICVMIVAVTTVLHPHLRVHINLLFRVLASWLTIPSMSTTEPIYSTCRAIISSRSLFSNPSSSIKRSGHCTIKPSP